MKCYDNCEIQAEYRKMDFHFDWLDCPYECEYGNNKLTAFRQSGCKTITEWYETDEYKEWERNA